MRGTSSWPTLKSKAANARHLAPYALELVLKYGTGSTEDNKILAVAQLLVRFYELLNENSMYLNEAAKTELARLGRRLCIIYSDLAADALVRGDKLWKVNPKLHIFNHLCEWQVPTWGINPRFFWTYADEDLVGHMIEIATSLHTTTLPENALFKWLHLSFSDQ